VRNWQCNLVTYFSPQFKFSPWRITFKFITRTREAAC
jgi:hypothetical protein